MTITKDADMGTPLSTIIRGLRALLVGVQNGEVKLEFQPEIEELESPLKTKRTGLHLT